MIRVAIADDQDLVRAGLRVMLEAEDDIEVVAEAVNGLDAVEKVRSTQPDIVLMDIRMPDLDGLAGRLVLETHRDDDVVAFPDVRLHRLEHIVVGAGECGEGESDRSRKGSGREE